MSKATKSTTELKAVVNEAPESSATGIAEQKPKRERKAREARTVEADLRRIRDQHMSKVVALREAEQKIETRLADVRKQRIAAEGPLARIEAVLAEDGGNGENVDALGLTDPAPEPVDVNASSDQVNQ